MKDTNITYLEKLTFVLSLMTTTPIMKIERETIGAMGIIQVIYYGVYVCICRVYLDVFKNIHHIHFSVTILLHHYIRVNVVVQ